MRASFILGVLILIVVVFLGLTAYLFGYPQYQKQQLEKETKEFLEQYANKYSMEDTTGGATPEETWSMFVEALKKGDIELAAKYFDPRERDKALEWLKIVKNNNGLEEMTRDLTSYMISKSKEKSDLIEYIVGPKEDGENSMIYPVFVKNSYTSIWKILKVTNSSSL